MNARQLKANRKRLRAISDGQRLEHNNSSRRAPSIPVIKTSNGTFVAMHRELISMSEHHAAHIASRAAAETVFVKKTSE
jgi:hypothetical protein